MVDPKACPQGALRHGADCYRNGKEVGGIEGWSGTRTWERQDRERGRGRSKLFSLISVLYLRLHTFPPRKYSSNLDGLAVKNVRKIFFPSATFSSLHSDFADPFFVLLKKSSMETFPRGFVLFLSKSPHSRPRPLPVSSGFVAFPPVWCSRKGAKVNPRRQSSFPHSSATTSPRPPGREGELWPPPPRRRIILSSICTMYSARR